MTLVLKLESYRLALYRWRAAQEFVAGHPPHCPHNRQPHPRDYGLETEVELEAANEVLHQAFNLRVHPGERVEKNKKPAKRTI